MSSGSWNPVDAFIGEPLAGDEAGEAAAVDRCHLRDLRATILHLMGLDHERLTHLLGGLADKATGVVSADVVRGPIA